MPLLDDRVMFLNERFFNGIKDNGGLRTNLILGKIEQMRVDGFRLC